MSASQTVRALLFTRWLSNLLFGGLFSLGLHAEAVSTEPPLELPTLTVTDLRSLPPPEAWRYAQLPGLEILTAVSDRETQKMLRDFQLFNDAIGVVWPGLKAHQPVPMSLLLCGAGKQFAGFVPTDDGNARTGTTSLLLRNSERAAIILNLGVGVINVDPTDVELKPAALGAGSTRMVALGATNLRVDYYQQLFREYVRYLLSFNQPRLPAWLEEGLAQLLMGMKVEPKFIEFARIEDPNLVSPLKRLLDPTIAVLPGTIPEEDPDFNKAFLHKTLMPLDEFFAVSHNSALANPFVGKWSKQAKGLVHMWLYGENKRFNQGFAQFVARSGQEPVTEAMFKECFGMSYDDMLLAFRIYVQNTAYQSHEFVAKKGGGLPEPKPLVLRDATQAEIGRLKGEAQLLAGHLELARDEMQASYARGVIDGPLLASLGLLEKNRGETVRARKFLEAAVQKQVVRPRAYLELANLRLDEMRPSGSVPPAFLTAAQTQQVLQPLMAGRQQLPPMPEIFELMAEVWLRSETAPSKQDLAVLNQGVMYFQRRPVLLLYAAELNGKYGDPDQALAMANHGFELSQTADARQAFEEIKAGLPPAQGTR
jgi:hypothetical protein